VWINKHKISYTYLILILTCFATLLCCLIEFYVNRNLNSKIRINYESGFYEEPIEVKLSTGSKYYITYTLDGSEPDSDSTRYEAPLIITDASKNENVWSAMKETSLKYFESDYYNIPNYCVDKCTVLRVAAFDENGECIYSDVREYFIGFDKKLGYEGLYNICVVSDPENLFSVESGIYNVGEYYNEKIKSGKINVMYSEESGWDKEGVENWTWSGRESERPATIELFDPQGKLKTREKCGIRIRGSFSRYNTQKTLGVYSRKEYSGIDQFGVNIFNDGDNRPKSFLIHSSGDDLDVKLKEYVIYAALSNSDTFFSVSPTVPCNLFIDGEYWGPMYLMKDMDRNTLSTDYGLSSDNIVLIKSGEVDIDNDYELEGEEELKQWNELQEFIRYEDMSIKDNYNYVCSKMDVDNLAEYFATEIYLGNADWHTDNNTAFWRTLKPEAGNDFSDGKWRCSIYDMNWAFQTQDVFEDEVYDYLGWDMIYMVQSMCKNEEFKALYLNKIEKLENEFRPDVVTAIFNEWTEVMEEPIKCQFRRFGISDDPGIRIQEEKDLIQQFLINRPNDIKVFNEWLFE